MSHNSRGGPGSGQRGTRGWDVRVLSWCRARDARGSDDDNKGNKHVTIIRKGGGGHGLRTHAGGPLAPPVRRHWGDAVPWKLVPPFLFAAWKGWVGQESQRPPCQLCLATTRCTYVQPCIVLKPFGGPRDRALGGDCSSGPWGAGSAELWGHLPGMIRRTVYLSVHRWHGMAAGKDDRPGGCFQESW